MGAEPAQHRERLRKQRHLHFQRRIQRQRAQRRKHDRRPEPRLPDGTLGSSSPFQQSKQQQNALRGPIPSLYIQDTYHANHQLTMVAGLRYGPNVMPHDYFNRGVEFNMADFLSNTISTVYPNAPAGSALLRRQRRDQAVHQKLVVAVLAELWHLVRSRGERQNSASRGWRS